MNFSAAESAQEDEMGEEERIYAGDTDESMLVALSVILRTRMRYT